MRKRVLFLSIAIIISIVLAFAGCGMFGNEGGDGDGDNTTDSVAPGEVTGLSKTVGNEQVTLQWTDPTDSDLDHIVITWGDSGSTEVDPDTGTYTAASLTNGEEYTFTVKTVDTSENVSTGETIKATPAADGTVTVNISGADATDGYYLWAFAYEEDEWNTDMHESVLALQGGEITSDPTEIVLQEGCDENWQPTGGAWTASADTTYDLYIYTTEDASGNTVDKQAVFPLQVTVYEDETVDVNYSEMTDYVVEGGTLTVNISGANEHEGIEFAVGVVVHEGDPNEETNTLAHGVADITDGSASITVQDADVGGDWEGTADTEYDVYFMIDAADDGSNGPTSGDYLVDPAPVKYYQDGDKVMNTTYPDDYELVE